MDKLRRLNFEELIKVGVPDVDTYTFDEYKRNNCEHTPINGYCVSCEEKRCNVATDDSSFQLTNISHGLHSSDFFQALKNKPNISDWHKEPIMFIYESPSKDYGIYKEVAHQGYLKHPSKAWYWIHNELNTVSYPQYFCGGQYGNFVLSAIMTFKLANVYMTNLVKCGLNNNNGDFKPVKFVKDEAVNNCYDKFLKNEIEIMNPKVIFAVGTEVENEVKSFLGDSYYIQQLPHPAGARRGFRNEHYKTIYYWGITQALHKVGIITTDEVCELAKLYLDKYDEKS